MGVGLSVGLNDFELMKTLVEKFPDNYAVQCYHGYRLLPGEPGCEGQSELLARTSPTIYDVFIALMGGLAGVVHSPRRRKAM